KAKEIVPFISEVDDSIIFDSPWIKTDKQGTSKEVQNLVKQITQKSFDAAVIFTTYSQSPLPAALICFLANIPKRLAFVHENPYQLLTHWVPDPEPNDFIHHEVQRQLTLVSEIGYTTKNEKLSLTLPKKTKQETQDFLTFHN